MDRQPRKAEQLRIEQMAQELHDLKAKIEGLNLTDEMKRRVLSHAQWEKMKLEVNIRRLQAGQPEIDWDEEMTVEGWQTIENWKH